MTVKVLEHNGIYTAYRRVVKRTDDGKLFESVKRIDFPFPPPDSREWGGWAMALSSEALDVGSQIFFDKWNFGNGSPQEGEIYHILHNEKQQRANRANVTVTDGTLSTSGDPKVVINFPVIER